MSTSLDKQKDPFALRQYIAMVIEVEKARRENTQNWVLVKPLKTNTHRGKTTGPVPHTHTQHC